MDNMKPLNPIQKTVVGVQFLFVAFGATVLVPLLVGLDPSTALFTAGIGTLIFHLVTKGKVPIFLGSSFAFVAPIIKATELYGVARYDVRPGGCGDRLWVDELVGPGGEESVLSSGFFRRW